DHLVGSVLRDVSAAFADHDRELALVVEQGGHARHVHVVPGPDHAGNLLVEEHRELGRLHAALGDVISVVEADAEELAWPDRRQQTYVGQRISLVELAVDDLIAHDHPVARSFADLEPAAPHDASGISTGACSGAYPPPIALAWISSKDTPSA